MKVDIARIEELVLEAHKEPSTWDEWLDARYRDDLGIVGHTNPYYKLFYLISQEFKPRFSVELGTYRGVAAGHLAAGNPDGMVYTVDWHRDPADKQHQVFAIGMDEHYDNVRYLNGCSWDMKIVQQVADVAVKTPIDILFIDAWHWYEHAIREWHLYNLLLSNEALVICDDIADSPGATIDMEKFWQEVSAGYEKFTNGDLHVAVRMGFFRFVRKKDAHG